MNNFIGFRTLLGREILRFTSVFKQTLFPPIVSSFLFITIFGIFIGRNLRAEGDIPYLKFLVPGLVMMYLIESAYQNTSTSLFIARWSNYIQELLVTPLSYLEMVLAMILGGLARSFVVAGGVFCVSLFFQPTTVLHPWIVLYFAFFVSLSFSCVGLLAGLLADEWEQISILTTFIMTPFIYFGGVFHSAQTIPEVFKVLMHFNPIFYMVNGMRYGIIGFSDVDVRIAMLVVLCFFTILFSTVVFMFRIGYKLKK